MDYVVGSVAALISGNVTPNRPKLIRRALTPTKHQPSPNVTPKSEFVEDRSIFLSPTLQKKKAIVKKSPKRIFENPDLDVTSESEGTTLSSPKADKVKKHLREELEADAKMSPKSPKNKKNKPLDTSIDEVSKTNSTPKKKEYNTFLIENLEEIQNNETPKKKRKSEGESSLMAVESISEINQEEKNGKSPKKSKKRLSVQIDQNTDETEQNEVSPKKKNKKRKLSQSNETEISESQDIVEKTDSNSLKKKNKKRNRKQKNMDTNEEVTKENHEEKPKKNKNKPIVNPNAVTDKDTDSEHESDDEIESENEEANKELLDTGPDQESSDEEQSTPKKAVKAEKVPASEDEVKRTLFVGNVPFTKKCKKEVKKIFNKYGTIETVRIRTVPVKDPRYTPKLAVIKNELHPERSTVNVYVKFKEESSVEQALAENNTVLNDNHLRVTRSESTGATHDPKCSVFVGNLPFGLEDEAFRAKFESCGEIESVRIIRDKKTNAGKGFGYINFASKDGVELALRLTEEDLTIKNRILRVKRCVQTKPGTNPGSKGEQSQGNKGFVRKNEGQGGMRPGGKFQGKGQGNFQGKFQGKGQGSFQQKGQGSFQQKGQGSFQQRDQGSFQQRGQGNFQGKGQGNFTGNNQEEGAYRRIMNKRKGQEGDGPPDKKGKFLNQPQKEKKARKEFVGMTAEKKKKHTFNKGQKKKKILSEILANK